MKEGDRTFVLSTSHSLATGCLRAGSAEVWGWGYWAQPLRVVAPIQPRRISLEKVSVGSQHPQPQDGCSAKKQSKQQTSDNVNALFQGSLAYLIEEKTPLIVHFNYLIF